MDDAGEVIILCVNMLQSLGFAVKGANRADAAVDMVRKEAFDLMIVDYKMPDLNGFEVYQRARQIRPNMSFMLLTGHGSSDVVEDATEMGFHAILLKPFTRQQLRDAVDQALSSRG